MKKALLALVAFVASNSLAATTKTTTHHKSKKAVSEESAVSEETSASQETAKPVAQEPKSKITFGLKVGYGFSNLLGDNLSPNGAGYSASNGVSTVSEAVTGVSITGNWKNKAGAMGGFYAEIPVTKMFSIEPELLYVQKGTKPTIQGGDIWGLYFEGEPVSSEILPGVVDVSKLSANMVLSADYVELPVLFKVNFKEIKGIAPSVFLGTEVGYLVSSNLNLANLINYDSRDLVKKVDFGVVIGAGVKVKDISFDLRYDLGLLNAFDKSGKTIRVNQQDVDYVESTPGTTIDVTLPTMKVKNSQAMLTVGYAFN